MVLAEYCKLISMMYCLVETDRRVMNRKRESPVADDVRIRPVGFSSSG